jgi:hypothetical protein
MELVGTMKAHIKSAIYDTTLGTNSAAPTQRASGGKPINKSDAVVCAPQARGACQQISALKQVWMIICQSLWSLLTFSR